MAGKKKYSQFQGIDRGMQNCFCGSK